MTEFNIEKNLDSLSENIKIINVYDKGLTSLPLQRFHNLEELNCDYNQLTCLPELNCYLLRLDCDNNQLPP